MKGKVGSFNATKERKKNILYMQITAMDQSCGVYEQKNK